VILGGVLGGLLGFLVSSLASPIYSAKSVINVWIDNTLASPMSERVEYVAKLRVQDLLLSDETLQGIQDRFETSPDDMEFGTLARIRSHIRLTRIGDQWILEVFSKNPETATFVADAWAQSCMVEIEEAIAAAWNIYELQSDVFGLGCQPISTQEDDPIRWACEFQESERVGDILGDLYLEVERSRGILPVFGYSLMQFATADSEPILRDRGVLILVGTLLGILVSLVILLYVRTKHPEESNLKDDSSQNG
jgi:hypothetical protein